MSPLAYSPWSPSEDRKLRELWPKPDLGLAEIGAIMGRSAAAIGYRGNALRLGQKPRTVLDWSDEKVANLRRMHQEGCSYAQIARALGATRNAVCGKAHRIGLSDPRRATKTREISGQRQHTKTLKERAAEIVARPKPKTKLARVSPPLPNATPLTLVDLERGMCRWPVGEDPGIGNGDRQLFCAAVAADDCSYCSHHAKRGHQKNRSPEEVATLAARAASARAAKRPGALQFSHKRAA